MYYNKRAFAVLAAGLAALGYASADSTLYPASLSTQTGTASKSDNLSMLQVKDQSGRQDTWDNYVEFYGSDDAYSGVFTFDVSGVDASKVSAYSLNVNYKGPRGVSQKWQFEYFNPSTNSWVAAGDNSDATKSWTWTPLSFCGQESFSKFVADGELKLRFSSDIKYDDCDIDYLSISTTVSDNNGSEPNTEAPATVKPTTKPSSAPTTRPSTAPTTRPTEKATQKPTERATQKPTERATQKPTERATQKPTERATQKPTERATQKPTERATQKPTEKATQKPTEKATQKPTEKATQKPTEKATQKPTTKPTTPATNPPSSGGRICPAGTVWVPQPGTTWQWQITETVDTSKDVQMYDIDLFSATTKVIDTLHSKGRVVICYFSTQFEDWRPDASKFPSSVLGNDLDDWEGEKYVDIRSSTVRKIMTERLDLAVSKGCDGVEPDNVDGYSSSNGFGLTAANQIEYNKFLAAEAHKRGLSIGLKNDLSQVAQLVNDFDWALNEQCNEYSECDRLKPFITAKKAVFGVEYEGSKSSVCPKMAAAQMSWLFKSLHLDSTGNACCNNNAAGGIGGCAPAPYTCVSYNSKRSDVEEENFVNAEIADNEFTNDNEFVNNDNAEVQTEQHFDSAASSTIFSAAVAVFSFATAVGAMLL